MRAEKEFFDYAYTCAEGKVQRGLMSSERYQHLRELFEKGEYPPVSELEECFNDAVPFLHELAEKMGLDVWDSRVVREYWLRYHNRIIDEGRGVYAKMPPALRDFCKVRIAKVVEVGKNYLRVEYGGKRQNAIYFGKGVHSGDDAIIHKGQFVKIPSKEEIEEYNKK